MLCVECGKREAKYDGLCEECFLKKVKFIDIPSHLDIVICPHCGAIKIGGAWKNLEFDKALSEILKKNIKFLHDYDNYNFEVHYTKKDGEFDVEVHFKIKYRDLEVSEYGIVNFTVKHESCPRCNRFFGNYFEAIIQLRGMQENEIEEIKEFLHRRVEHYSKRNENLFITREEEKREGWNFYMSDKKESKKIAKDICNKYGGSLKESPQIAGRKDGRDVYRVTYSVRLPDYRSGDIVRIENNYYQIHEISGSFIKGISLKTGKWKMIDSKKHRVELVEKKNNLKYALVIYARGNNAQIMDENYKTIDIKIPFPVKNGERIKIVKIDETIYIVP